MTIYLISAESYHIINDEIKKIVKDNSFTTFNMNKITLREAIEEASYFSLDSNKKYLVLNNADFFGTAKIDDADQDLLIKYINNPNPNTIVIFTTEKSIDSRKKIVKEIKSKGTLTNIGKMDRKVISNTLTKYVGDKGFNIDYKSVNYIIENSYSNLDIMFNELDKIMLFYNNKCTIKYEDVIYIVGEELDSNNFHFVNAVIEKDLQKALKIFNSLKIYKVEPTSLVILLAREYRLMYYVKNLYRSMNLQDIMSYLSLADWQINKLYTNSSKFSNTELLDNLAKLCDIDINIKKGIWDKDIALYGFLMDACS